MAQVYFLSVLVNMLAGLALAGDYLGERISLLAPLKNLQAHRPALTTLAIVTLVVGVLKLIVLSPGETVPVAGDLLPALAGIAMGGLLLAQTFRPRSEQQSETAERFPTAVLNYRMPVGIAGVAVAIVQFLLPGVIIL